LYRGSELYGEAAQVAYELLIDDTPVVGDRSGNARYRAHKPFLTLQEVVIGQTLESSYTTYTWYPFGGDSETTITIPATLTIHDPF